MKSTLILIFSVGIIFFARAHNEVLTLNYDLAKKMAGLPLHCIEQEYPNKLNQVLTDSTFINSPENLHPVFYGCFDWHSSVHGHWLLAKVMNKFPDSDLAKQIVTLFDKQFTKENIEAELRYFEPKLEKSFERTYGWAWLLKLQEELLKSPFDIEHGWSVNLKPLSDFIAESYKTFLPKLAYPVRVGEHANTAFGLSLTIDYARISGDKDLEELILKRSMNYYMPDCDCPLTWEPGGFDFISPCLQEAELMGKILSPEEFEKWMKKFLPDLFKKKFELEPGKVLDRTDGKLVHLDGLNFSRAWCFYGLGLALPKKSDQFRNLGDAHIMASIDQVAGSDYMGSHWLASFLVYALEKREMILGSEEKD